MVPVIPGTRDCSSSERCQSDCCEQAPPGACFRFGVMNNLLQYPRMLPALVRLVQARLDIHRRGFSAAWVRFALRPPAMERRPADVAFITRAVHGLGSRLGLTCLPRSLALCSLLRERGYPAEIRIGVRREAGRLLAHAWVELDGETLGETLHPEWQVLPMEQAASILKKVVAPTS